MTSVMLDFDTSEYKPDEGFEPLPAGDYPVFIKSVDLKDTKDGSGMYLSVTLVVVDGPGKGRMIFDNLNVKNKSATAQEIGRKQLAGLLEAVGRPGEKDMSAILDAECYARVQVKDDPKYGAKNRVVRYMSAGAPSRPAAPVQRGPSGKGWLK